MKNQNLVCDPDSIVLSIIIPCYNEEQNIEEIYKKLHLILTNIKYKYEIIFIDDGSVDETLIKLIGLSQSDKNVRVLELSRNFGHQAAICAGIDYAEGKAVIMMDADLQHPPELIPELIKKWEEGYDIVYTIRKYSNNVSFFKKITSRIFYKLINKFANINIPENSADFRLLDYTVIKEFKKLKEREKFIRGLISWMGFKQCAIEYIASPRFAGNSKYSLLKMIKLALVGITSFSAFPLRIATILGFLISIFSFIYASYALCIWLFLKITIPGWTSVIVTVLFLGGIQLICTGIVGEYLGRVFDETATCKISSP